MLSSRRVRLSVLGGFVSLVVLGVAWIGWQVWQVNRDLADAVAHAEALRSAVEAGDDAAIDQELADLQAASQAAADGTSGVTWSLLTHVPVYGDDARGVRLASEVVDDLAHDGIEPLINAALDLERLLPRNGTVPIDAIDDLVGPVTQAADAFAAADDALAAEETAGYESRLRTKYDDLHAEIARATDAMAAAETAVAVLPTMLGDDSAQEHLLVFQNNAEVRATGGLPGSVALLGADAGTLTIQRQVAVASLARAEEPVLPITDSERKLFDDVPASYFQSANMLPDVPRVADLMTARWQQEFPRDQVAGVILVDTVALSYVIDAVGPITVDGVTLDGDNLVDELLHNTYLRIDDPVEQDEFFAEVARAAFEKFTTGADNPTGLIRALGRATDEGRVYVHSFDADVQAELSGTAIAGEFADADSQPSTTPEVAVTVNDTTASKMSYFLRYDLDVSTTYCTDGVQGLSAKMRLHSTAPVDASSLPEAIIGGDDYGQVPGSQIVTVRIYGPVGGKVGELELNAKPENLVKVDQDGRPVGMTYIELKPGQTVDLSWSMTTADDATGDVDVSVTPSIERGTLGGSVPSAC